MNYIANIHNDFYHCHQYSETNTTFLWLCASILRQNGTRKTKSV